MWINRNKKKKDVIHLLLYFALISILKYIIIVDNSCNRVKHRHNIAPLLGIVLVSIYQQMNIKYSDIKSIQCVYITSR